MPAHLKLHDIGSHQVIGSSGKFGVPVLVTCGLWWSEVYVTDMAYTAGTGIVLLAPLLLALFWVSLLQMFRKWNMVVVQTKLLSHQILTAFKREWLYWQLSKGSGYTESFQKVVVIPRAFKGELLYCQLSKGSEHRISYSWSRGPKLRWLAKIKIVK